jgi:hypothetical protein
VLHRRGASPIALRPSAGVSGYPVEKSAILLSDGAIKECRRAPALRGGYATTGFDGALMY